MKGQRTFYVESYGSVWKLNRKAYIRMLTDLVLLGSANLETLGKCAVPVIDLDISDFDPERAAMELRALKASNPSKSKAKPASSEPPICEECDEPMNRYSNALDTGKDGWQCGLCGWSQDDE